jgi:hypothetical protein
MTSTPSNLPSDKLMSMAQNVCVCVCVCVCTYIYIYIVVSFFCSFELRASWLLGRCSTT